MKLFCLGLSHRTAPVDVRERLAFREEAVPEALRALLEGGAVSEAVIASTCNRVEIYGVADDLNAGLRRALAFLGSRGDADAEKLRDHFYSHTALDAVRHLFRVCASLDSLIVGEAQILGQMKDAYRIGAEAGATGPTLNRVFHKAFTAAKRVRTETEIGRKALSVSHAAADLAQKIFGSLEGRAALLVGAGEMARLAAEQLRELGASPILVANRTPERSAEMAAAVGGRPVPFEEVPERLASVDIVVCSAAAPHYLVRPEHAEPALEARRGRPMFFIDISVPRNVDPAINDLPGAYYYDIDDLETVVRANRKEREREASRAEELIDEEMAGLYEWVRSLEWAPSIAAVRQKADRIAQEELERTLKSLKSVSEEDRARLEKMTQAIVSKMLHEPIRQVKQEALAAAREEEEASRRESPGLVGAFRKLFGLDD